MRSRCSPCYRGPGWCESDRIGAGGCDNSRVQLEARGWRGARLKGMLFRAGEGPLAAALLERGAPLHVAGHLRAEAWNGSVERATLFMADATLA